MIRTLLWAIVLWSVAIEARAGRERPAPGEAAGPSDAALAGAIARELMRQPGVRSDEVDVKVQDGVVVMSGRVKDLLSAERAVAIARAVLGVRAVVDLVELDPPERTDLSLVGGIRTAWALDPACETYQMHVDVVDGVARLSGTVESTEERLAAERLAKGVAGVVGVKNDVVVEPVTHRSDVEVRDDVRSRLRWDLLVDAGRLEVDVLDGHVTLRGVVTTEDERRRVVELARTEGARMISNLVTVEPGATRPLRLAEPVVLDRELADAVRTALRHDPRVLAGSVDVQVRDGVVRLVGQVETEQAARAALGDALGAVGARSVESELAVRAARVATD